VQLMSGVSGMIGSLPDQYGDDVRESSVYGSVIMPVNWLDSCVRPPRGADK
jgi:hypothetical protein